MKDEATLVIRIGSMGDIVHTLPAVASLKASQPNCRLSWLVAERWLPLLRGNPSLNDLVVFDRSSWHALHNTVSQLRSLRVADAVDFQGLIKSAFCGRLARPKRFFGFESAEVREWPASWFYTHRIPVTSAHRVERNLQLAIAAGATKVIRDGWLPEGADEGNLPSGPFVLAAPFAGWQGKEWPLDRFNQLGQALRREGIYLLANVPPSRVRELDSFPHIRTHSSSLLGLVGAVRRASAVIACDSGPLHLAAALGKRGVALFGPTDPAKNGPYGGTLTVLRASGFETTYKRGVNYHRSMEAITVEQVFQALTAALARQETSNVL